MASIDTVIAREILDSRGNPTLEVSVLLDDGSSPAGTEVVRLWQENLLALMAERTINWTCLASGCVWMASAGSPS